MCKFNFSAGLGDASSYTTLHKVHHSFDPLPGQRPSLLSGGVPRLPRSARWWRHGSRCILGSGCRKQNGGRRLDVCGGARIANGYCGVLRCYCGEVWWKISGVFIRCYWKHSQWTVGTELLNNSVKERSPYWDSISVTVVNLSEVNTIKTIEDWQCQLRHWN